MMHLEGGSKEPNELRFPHSFLPATELHALEQVDQLIYVGLKVLTEMIM
jgi:hypothetical protein